MKTKKITFNRENKECSGYVDIFDNSDFKTLNSLYFDWKKMNEIVVKMNSRRINLPEIISEGLSSLLFNLVRTNNTSFTNITKVSFDCLNPSTGKTYQIKAVSTLTEKENGGPTSFGPRSEADVLILAHFICEENKVKFYQFEEDLEDFKVNKTETFREQCLQGRRPRFSLLKEIKKQNLIPIKEYIFGE